MPSFSVSNILTKAEVSRSAELEDAISKYLTKSRGDDQWVDDASSVFMETTFWPAIDHGSWVNRDKDLECVRVFVCPRPKIVHLN